MGWQQHMKFNRARCQSLPLGRNNLRHQHRLLGADWLEGSLSENALQILSIMVNPKLTMSQQCACATKVANSVVSCVRMSVISKSRVGILPALSALLKPHLE